jgi:hypothetical protein
MRDGDNLPSPVNTPEVRGVFEAEIFAYTLCFHGFAQAFHLPDVGIVAGDAVRLSAVAYVALDY